MTSRRFSSYAFIGLLSLWLLGFLGFIIDTLIPYPFPPSADGIVVLTGGAGRIEASIDLLKTRHGNYLLISGVGQQATLSDLENNLSEPIPMKYRKYILIGHNATSTMGNAIETAAWVHCYDIHSAIIVTSSYHIRRALLEIRNILPKTTLYPYVSKPVTLRELTHRATIRLFFVEYNKWLAATIGLIHTRHSEEIRLSNLYDSSL